MKKNIIREAWEEAFKPLSTPPPAPRRKRLGEQLAEYLEPRQPPSPRITLTAQQRRILDLVITGLKDTAIGDELHLSYGTVRGHIGRLFHKFGVNCRVQLVAAFIKMDSSEVAAVKPPHASSRTGVLG